MKVYEIQNFLCTVTYVWQEIHRNSVISNLHVHGSPFAHQEDGLDWVRSLKKLLS